MATLVITIVTPDSAQAVKDLLVIDGTSPYTITSKDSAIDRVARYVDGVANGSFANTSVVVAIS